MCPVITCHRQDTSSKMRSVRVPRQADSTETGCDLVQQRGLSEKTGTVLKVSLKLMEANELPQTL